MSFELTEYEAVAMVSEIGLQIYASWDEVCFKDIEAELMTRLTECEYTLDEKEYDVNGMINSIITVIETETEENLKQMMDEVMR
jgi:hypothetical protein